MAIVESAEAGLRAAAKGATVIQLRAPLLAARELEREACSLVARAEVNVVISSRADLALACGASGVNLPERDISVAAARALLGQHWVSRSVHSLEAALSTDSAGADCLIFGPVWATASHPGREPMGLAELEAVAEASAVPVVAVGGVTMERIPDVLAVCAGYASISLFR